MHSVGHRAWQSTNELSDSTDILWATETRLLRQRERERERERERGGGGGRGELREGEEEGREREGDRGGRREREGGRERERGESGRREREGGRENEGGRERERERESAPLLCNGLLKHIFMLLTIRHRLIYLLYEALRQTGEVAMGAKMGDGEGANRGNNWKS